MIRNTIVALAGALILAGCAGTGGTQVTPAEIANDISLADEALQAALPQLTNVNVPSSVVDALKDIDEVAKSVSTAETMSSLKPKVQRIEDDVNAAVRAGALVPSPIQKWLADFQVLLVPAEIALNIVVPASAASNGMTPDDARDAMRAMIVAH